MEAKTINNIKQLQALVTSKRIDLYPAIVIALGFLLPSILIWRMCSTIILIFLSGLSLSLQIFYFGLIGIRIFIPFFYSVPFYHKLCLFFGTFFYALNFLFLRLGFGSDGCRFLSVGSNSSCNYGPIVMCYINSSTHLTFAFCLTCCFINTLACWLMGPPTYRRTPKNLRRDNEYIFDIDFFIGYRFYFTRRKKKGQSWIM